MSLTIALVAARDGVGKTTLATSLATALARRFPEQVVLAEICGQFGNVGLLLNLSSRDTILELAHLAAEMDSDLVEGFLVKHPSGVRVLPGGARPDPLWTEAISVTFVAQLLATLRKNYRFVVCDMPPTVWPGGLYAISRSQLCLAVGGLADVSSVRDLAALLSILIPTHVPLERARLVVSRPHSQECFTEEEMAAATRLPVWHSIPNDPASVVAAANEAEPILLSRPQSPYARSITALADRLLAEHLAEATAPA